MKKLGTPCRIFVGSRVSPGNFQDISLSDFKSDMDVNFFGAVHVVRAVLPSMVLRGSGSVTLISSAAGLIGLWGYGAYSPTSLHSMGLRKSLNLRCIQKTFRLASLFHQTQTPQLKKEKESRPAETDIVAASGGVWTAEEVAKAIVNGTEKGKFLITPGSAIYLLSRFRI